MDELARLKRELDFAKASNAKLPEAEKALLRHAHAAELQLGYLRETQYNEPAPAPDISEQTRG
jgi:hypothetical protein